MGNTHRIIDGLDVVRRCGGPVGGDGRRCGQHVDGPFKNGDSRRLHADPVRAVILSESGAAERNGRGGQKLRRPAARNLHV